MKDCKFCDKSGLLILPLRYAAVVGDDVRAQLPALPATLGAGVSDLALTHGQYAPRLLRQGFVYTLINRAGVKYWQAYYATDDAFLSRFDPDTPPSTPIVFTCDRTACGIDASCIAIDKVETVSKVYLLFSPTALTKAKLGEYKSKADALVSAGKMQAFDPNGWITGATHQPHSLTGDLVATHAPEWLLAAKGAAGKDSPLGQAMTRQMFVPAQDSFVSQAPGRLGVLTDKLKRVKGAAFVIHDHIGIAQELNDFRNAALEGVQNYLAATDQYGSSNEQRMQVYEAIQEAKAGMMAGFVRPVAEFIDQHRQSSDQYFDNRMRQAQHLRLQGNATDAKLIEDDVSESLKNRAANYQKALKKAEAEAPAIWKRNYDSRLDVDEMQLFHGKLASHTEAAFKTVAARTEQHVRWFESDRLVDAFDVFDAKDSKAGIEFAVNSAICTIGLSGCKAGEDKIDKWIRSDSIARGNLYMRGVLYNSDDLTKQLMSANEQIKIEAGKVELASGIGAAVMLKATKGLIDGFKKTDSAFDEWARNQGQSFSKKWTQSLEIVLYHKASELTKAIFRTGLGGTFDKVLTAKLSGLLYARLASVTEKLAYDELMLSLPEERVGQYKRARTQRRAQARADAARVDKASTGAANVAAQVEGSLETLVSDAQDKARAKVRLSLADLKENSSPPTNNFHQTRIGVILGCIEMIALGEKLTHFENTEKGWLEVGGSAMAVGSIVLDTYYSAAKSIREIQPYKGIKVINDGADIVRGGFKIGAGVLGFGAGVCSALLDWSKFRKESDEVLSTIYMLRAVSGATSTLLSIAAALSYTAPMLRNAAARFGEKTVAFELLDGAAALALRLALRVRLLVWVARFNWIGLAFTAAEIGYMLLKDDDLQNWCEKCTFRLQKTHQRRGVTFPSEHYPNVQKEVEEFERATQAVGLGGHS